MMTPGYAAYDRWARANKGGDPLADGNPFFKLPYAYEMVVTPESPSADSYSDFDFDTSTEDDDLSELGDTLTWDPTIWAPRDPDDFHPPGLEGVVQKRKYWGGRTIPPKRAQLVPRSTYPWWFRMYVWRIIGNGACPKDFEPFHGFLYAGEREIMESNWRLFV
ncbi:hypothetical protein F4821DRAFT_245663 [Hypoxylon rubiginosum]|uniref:Uncharacterized protein n=1 Tax=Hypoxylon rubiginosum TaxID=110542 RepID=A0ACC0CRL0_9PEZI|nr:hypothetical protein F4821DRAFT_245663 [Hypoxylon rubiginosum]